MLDKGMTLKISMQCLLATLLLALATLSHVEAGEADVKMTLPIEDPVPAAISAELSNNHYLGRVDHFRHVPMIQHAIVMLGDSLTEQGLWNEYFQGYAILNRGIGGDNTFGILHRLEEFGQTQPDKLFLLAGINDLSNGDSPIAIAARYRNILEILRRHTPKTRVYLQSVLPVRTNLKKGAAYETNAMVIELNILLRQLSKDLNLVFIEVGDALKDEQGELDASLCTDAVHLNGSGYARWAQQIKPYVVQ